MRIETAPASEYADRLARVRAYMREEHIDVILDPASNTSNMDLWLTGEFLSTGLVIPSEGPVTAVYGGADVLPDGTVVLPDGRPVENSGNPYVRIAAQVDYEAILAPAGTVGLLHCEGGSMPYGFKKRIGKLLEGKDVRYVTYDINRIKSMRSELEVALNRDTGEMVEKVFKAFPSVCRRGRLYKSVTDDLQYLIASLGSPGDLMVCQVRAYDLEGNNRNGPYEGPGEGRRVEDGQIVAVLIETNGPSNLYATCSRTFAFGEPSEKYRKAWELAVRTSKLCGQLLTPGANLVANSEKIIDLIRASGYDIPGIHMVQSQGYSCAEDPRATETAPLIEGTPIICHPMIYFKGRPFLHSEDIKCLSMYVVAKGGGRPVNALSTELMVL